MTQEEKEIAQKIQSDIQTMLQEKPEQAPLFCDKCGLSNSVMQQDVWCSICSGKMMPYPDMTWQDCLLKCYHKETRYFIVFENAFISRYNLDTRNEDDKEKIWYAGKILGKMLKELINNQTA